MTTDTLISDIIESVIKMDEDALTALVSSALEQGIDPLVIINDGLTVGLRKVGDLFAEEEIFLPELVLAGEIVTKVMETLKPRISGEGGVDKKGRFLIATVKGDVHDIGKNLVALLLSASGYDVVDLGKDVSAETIVEKIDQLSPEIIGLSALLSTTMPAQKQVIEAIEEAGMREKVKIMVGGAPVTREWAEQIGADGYAEDASSAVTEADRIMSKGS